jgi:hypothetical protein
MLSGRDDHGRMDHVGLASRSAEFPAGTGELSVQRVDVNCGRAEKASENGSARPVSPNLPNDACRHVKTASNIRYLLQQRDHSAIPAL